MVSYGDPTATPMRNSNATQKITQMATQEVTSYSDTHTPNTCSSVIATSVGSIWPNWECVTVNDETPAQRAGVTVTGPV